MTNPTDPATTRSPNDVDPVVVVNRRPATHLLDRVLTHADVLRERREGRPGSNDFAMAAEHEDQVTVRNSLCQHFVNCHGNHE